MTESTATVKPDYETARDEMRALLESLGVTVDCEFVPLSRSRNAGEKHPSVNWRVTVRRRLLDSFDVPRGKPLAVLTSDYSQGVAHLKGYDRLRREGWESSVDGVESVKRACETLPRFYAGRAPIPYAVAPTREDVLSSLAVESDVIDSATFEEWASEFGYDADSRKGEAIYRQCLETALKLRAALGDAALTTLREQARRF